MVEDVDGSGLTHRTVELRGVQFHYVEAGEGPLVVLLHGFPEFWYSWRKLIPALAAAGFRVIAPDLRGYALSGKPEGRAPYTLGELTADVAALIESTGAGRAAAVVGHDWGGGIAWSFAMRHPALLERLVILNAPHPDRLVRALGTARQLAKSWYMFFFQVPKLPELFLRRNNFEVLRASLRDDTRPGAVSAAELDHYTEAWAAPGALEAMLAYYRAMFLPASMREGRELTRIDAPVLVIWGEDDRFLGADLATPDPKWATAARVVFVPQAGHFVQHDQPERVSELIRGFLGETAATPR